MSVNGLCEYTTKRPGPGSRALAPALLTKSASVAMTIDEPVPVADNEPLSTTSPPPRFSIRIELGSILVRVMLPAW